MIKNDSIYDKNGSFIGRKKTIGDRSIYYDKSGNETNFTIERKNRIDVYNSNLDYEGKISKSGIPIIDEFDDE